MINEKINVIILTLVLCLTMIVPEQFKADIFNPPPEITSVYATPENAGYGVNVTINATVTDNSSVDTVKCNVTYPDSTFYNFTMSNTGGDYYECIVNQTWQVGQYNYTIWAVDDKGKGNTSSGHTFNVSHLFGYTKIGSSYKSVEDNITGSVFTVNKYGIADNITAYINQNFMSPGPYKCMIYRANDSKLIGTTIEDWYSLPSGNPQSSSWWAVFNFTDPKPVVEKDVEYVLTCWGNNSYSHLYYNSYEDSIGRYNETTYGTPPEYPVFSNESRIYSIYCCYTSDTTPPEIADVSNTPDTVGFGFNVVINANVTDSVSGVGTVNVSIAYPDNTTTNYTMNNTYNDTYKCVFNDTWQNGQHNYTIWATDNSNNINSSTGHTFNVSANATVTVCTTKASYSNNEIINITDPPGGGKGGRPAGSGVFGNPSFPNWQNVTVEEDDNWIVVDNSDGLIWKFRKGTAGYNEIWHNDTLLVEDEQWVLEYKHNNNWKQRGEPQSVSYEQPELYHVVVKRFYNDFEGAMFNIVYEFYGGYHTKISFEGNIGQPDDYRIVWKASGINTDYIEHNQSANHTKVWDDGEEGFVFGYTDIYQEFGNITEVEIEQQANNHKVSMYFYVGELEEGFFWLDPNFGFETLGGSSTNLVTPSARYIGGSLFTCPHNGRAISMTCALKNTDVSDKPVHFAIYTNNTEVAGGYPESKVANTTLVDVPGAIVLSMR